MGVLTILSSKLIASIRLSRKEGFYRFKQLMESLKPVMDENATVNTITEGKATCKLNKKVFYNPVQELNRDISIQFLNIISQYEQNSTTRVKLLEALAASGLRSARYALELPSDKFELHANDHDQSAFQLLQQNLKDYPVEIHCSDACELMRRNLMFSVIDIDPYGSPAKFLESAIVGVKRPGVLMITATDAAVLCGSGPHQRTCSLGKYSSLPMPNNSSCHEFGLRILLFSILQHCARYGVSMSPLMSLSVDFYFRVFVQLKRGQSNVKDQLLKFCGYCLYCPDCRSKWIIPMDGNVLSMNTCTFCSRSLSMAGPLWIGPLHSSQLLENMLKATEQQSCELKTKNRMIGIFTVMLEELDKCPLYIVLTDMCKKLQTTTPSMKIFRSAIVNAGYSVSSTHCNKEGLKTDAPYSVLWTLLAKWASNNPGKSEDKLSDLAKTLRSYKCETELNIDFKLRLDAQSKAQITGLKRFPPNPEPFWGPAKRPRESQNSNT
ncbi:hypothetical protein GJ496_001659 [Pomphorhynchus laevis]|nr:hypothetical protein GJ496_001659 [Pomphorhynchus laevis]